MAGAQDETVRVRIPGRIDFAGGWSDVCYFSEQEGGMVVNAAISPYVEGSARWQQHQLHLEYTLDLPPGSHLGSSASIDVAWLSLVNGLTERKQSPVQLAEAAYQLEKLLGVTGGKQDQYAAALGGFTMLRFAAEDEPATVERLDVSAGTIQALSEHSVLCYAGPPAGAGSVHQRVWERYGQGDKAITLALREIRDSVLPARDALLSGKLEALAEILTINREAVRRLDQDIITPYMDDLFTAASDAGAQGSKACGEGGGGCLFSCARKAARRRLKKL